METAVEKNGEKPVEKKYKVRGASLAAPGHWRGGYRWTTDADKNGEREVTEKQLKELRADKRMILYEDGKIPVSETKAIDDLKAAITSLEENLASAEGKLKTEHEARVKAETELERLSKRRQ